MRTLTTHIIATGIITLTILSVTSAQKLETFKQFKTFTAGDTKFQAEIKAGKIKGFKTKDFVMTYEPQAYSDTTIQYSDLRYTDSLTDTDIDLLFCNGILYWTSIEFNYDKDESETAEQFFNQLKTYIPDNYTILDSNDYIISNESYGSQIGILTQYILNKDSDNYQVIEVGLRGVLSSPSPNSKTMIMTGFIVYCNIVDLSYVPLNADDGYMTYN